ncbi:hypothetical protein FRC12_006666 [Ceratobasidium sp. 428]|nr:hypothetical protein FRC12_006666 [Ceratobasidium sp. 428]
MTVATLFSIVLLGLGVVRGAPTPSTNSSGVCTTKYTGKLATNPFGDSSGGNVMSKLYYFNKEGEVAFDPSGTSYPPIIATFQVCTSNYAGVPGGVDGDQEYGRFYIDSLKKCLAVTNPSGSPPYFLGTQPCPSDADMASEASIPSNFVADGSGGEVDMRWIGDTIPSKNQFQNGASACQGELFVDSTNLQHGYNYDGLGQPNTNQSDDYRVHLYCNRQQGGQATGYNSFTVPVN